MAGATTAKAQLDRFLELTQEARDLEHEWMEKKAALSESRKAFDAKVHEILELKKRIDEDLPLYPDPDESEDED